MVLHRRIESVCIWSKRKHLHRGSSPSNGQIEGTTEVVLPVESAAVLEVVLTLKYTTIANTLSSVRELCKGSCVTVLKYCLREAIQC